MILSKSKTVLKTLAYLALILSLYSLSASFLGAETGTAPYSILNNSENGLSRVRNILEKEMNLETKVLVSTLKSLSRINSSAVIVIMAPSLPYDYEEVIALLEFIATQKAGVLIVDDFGKANTLLRNIWLLFSLQSFLGGGEEGVVFKGIYFNTSAVTADAGSFWKTPTNPVITNFMDSYGFLHDIHKILTIFPSSLSINLEINGTDIFVPLPAGLLQTTSYSWLETNVSDALKGKLSPDPWEWGGLPFSLGLAIEMGNTRVAFICDPDIFSNKVLDISKREGFDNEKFVRNLFDWLTRSGEINLIIFDEAHMAHLPTDPLYGLMLWLKVLSEASSSWFVAPVLPLLIFSIITGYLPKERPTSSVLLSKVERVTEESPFRRRLKWYKRSRDYKNALSILSRHLLLEIRRKYGTWGEDLRSVIDRLLIVRYDLAKDEATLRRFAEIMDSIVSGKRKIKKARDFAEIINLYRQVVKILEV